MRRINLWSRPARFLVVAMLFALHFPEASGQAVLTLRASVEKGVRDHGAVTSKRSYVSASQALLENTRNEYLPNVVLSAQHSYGTINGQFGPMAPVGALGVSSAGPALPAQSWNAAFGATYIASANWEAFTFGRVKSRIEAGKAQLARDSADLEQERFVHQVKIASSYLTLLIARQLVSSAEANLARVESIAQSVKARTRSGINAGVDSSLVNADVARARMDLIDFISNEQVARKNFADLLNASAAEPVELDSIYRVSVPDVSGTPSPEIENPQLTYFRLRAGHAGQLSEVYKKSIMPALTLFGVYQARASGFTNSYNAETSTGFSKDYWDGISPSRYNYVAGLSLSWNVMSPLKVRQQVHAQRFVADALRQEYDQANQVLNNQVILSEQQLQNSVRKALEAPIQFEAASAAYVQKNVLYGNGLTTIVDLQQALYALNRAQIDRSVAYINVWVALLTKAAATGDFALFINQAR